MEAAVGREEIIFHRYNTELSKAVATEIVRLTQAIPQVYPHNPQDQEYNPRESVPF